MHSGAFLGTYRAVFQPSQVAGCCRKGFPKFSAVQYAQQTLPAVVPWAMAFLIPFCFFPSSRFLSFPPNCDELFFLSYNFKSHPSHHLTVLAAQNGHRTYLVGG